MANEERIYRLQCDQPAISQPTKQTIEQVQILIKTISCPWGKQVQQRYSEIFRDENICRSLDVLERRHLQEMNIDDEHQDDIMQGIHQWLVNNSVENFESLVPGLFTERMDDIKETEESSNVVRSSFNSYSKMACSTARSVASEESIRRKRELILKTNTESSIEVWQIKKFWRKRFGALKDCKTVRESGKKNEFILGFKDEEARHIAHQKGIKYQLDLKQQHKTAEENNLAKLKIEYKLCLNRGVRPSPKHPVRYQALCNQSITKGKNILQKIGVLKKDEVVIINQMKSSRVRVYDPEGKVIYDPEGKVKSGWVWLHSWEGVHFLQRLE